MNESTRTNILIPGNPNDQETILLGFQCLNKLAEDNPDIQDCVLFVATKANMNHTSLSMVLGESSTKSLDKGHTKSFRNFRIRLETLRTMRGYTQADAVLAVYADPKMMDVLDTNKGLKAIVAIPYAPSAIDEWKHTWNPSTPSDTSDTSEQTQLIQDPVVEKALSSLTTRVNLGHASLHPLDQEATKDAFRILRSHKHYEEPSNIRAWCIRNGWNPKAATEVAAHAQKAFALRSKPKGVGAHWASNIYEIWNTSSG